MSEPVKHNPSQDLPQADSEAVALIKKMQQQLVFLEKKIDILINQSSERPFKRNHFSRPFRPPPHRSGDFPHSHRSGKGANDHRSGERNFARGRYFDKQQSGESRELGQGKKPFFQRRKGR